MIEEWIRSLLERNNAANVEVLTQDMILEEIQESIASLKNENLWALGSPTKESAAIHTENMETLVEYIKILGTMITV